MPVPGYIVDELRSHGVLTFELIKSGKNAKLRFDFDGKVRNYTLGSATNHNESWRNQDLNNLRRLMGVRRIITRSKHRQTARRQEHA